MDETETRLLTEGNALKARELDLREKRNAALLATLWASLVTIAAIGAAWWGIEKLAPTPSAWALAVFCSSIVAGSVILFSLWCLVHTTAEDDRDAKRLMIAFLVLAGLLIISAFGVGLTWSRF